MKSKLTALLLSSVMILSMVPSVFAAEDEGINLYFVRHGKTIMSTLGKVQGWSDSPLTEEGKAVAVDTAYGLAEIKFDSVYSSDKMRASETAKILLEHNTATDKGIEIVEMEGLRETNYGKYEGGDNGVMWGTASKVLGASNDGELYANSMRDITNAWAKEDETGQAETFEQCIERLMTSVETIAKEAAANGDKNVLITGHGMAIGNIMTEIDGNAYGELPNASISLVNYRNGKFEVVAVGDTRYTEKGNQIRNAEVVIYLTRHGKTLFNTNGLTQGWVDSPLTAEGVAVAENLGKGLANVDFTAVYSSDMGRAYETAQLVLKHSINSSNLDITKLQGIRETHYGSFESGVNMNMLMAGMVSLGLTGFDDLKMAEYENFLEVMTNEISALGGGEDYYTMSSRVSKTIKEIVNEVKFMGGGNVLVVSHGNAIMSFLAEQGIYIPSGEIGNASVQKIIYKDGVYTIESYDDMSYVKNGALK